LLNISANKTLKIGQDYEVCFHVQNPTVETDSYQISLQALNSCGASIPRTETKQTSNTRLHVAKKDLNVTALQSSPFLCSENTITLHISANFHIRSKSVITLTGLGDKINKDGIPTVSLTDASGGYDHSVLFRRNVDIDGTTCPDQSEHGICPPTGLWVDNKDLVLTVADDKNLVAGERYAISFEVENPYYTVIGTSPQTFF